MPQMNVLTFLGYKVEEAFYDLDNSISGEATIITPALKKLGFTDIFYHEERGDSCNPFVRGIVATAPSGKIYRFYYLGKCTFVTTPRLPPLETQLKPPEKVGLLDWVSSLFLGRH